MNTTNMSFNDLKKKLTQDIIKGIPHESVDLPSGIGKASIIPLKVKETKDFLKALEKQDEYLMNEAFDKMLSKCVLDINGEPFDVDDLCIQDRTFLLIMIRKLMNPKAKISHICPVSQKVINDIEVDLNSFVVDAYKGDSLNSEIFISENIKFTLAPFSRKDERNVEKWMKNKGKEKSAIDARYCGYAALIKEVFAKNDSGDFVKVDLTFENKVDLIVETCTQDIVEKIDDYIKNLDFGIRLKFHFKSDVYENEAEEAMLLSFFIV